MKRLLLLLAGVLTIVALTATPAFAAKLKVSASARQQCNEQGRVQGQVVQPCHASASRCTATATGSVGCRPSESVAPMSRRGKAAASLLEPTRTESPRRRALVGARRVAGSGWSLRAAVPDSSNHHSRAAEHDPHHHDRDAAEHHADHHHDCYAAEARPPTTTTVTPPSTTPTS